MPLGDGVGDDRSSYRGRPILHTGAGATPAKERRTRRLDEMMVDAYRWGALSPAHAAEFFNAAALSTRQLLPANQDKAIS